MQYSLRRFTLLLGALAYALDIPLYLVLVHLPWPIYPVWALPGFLLCCTTSGLVAVWVRERVRTARRFQALGDVGALLLLCCAVPVVFALGVGYLSTTVWAASYPAGTNWLASALLLLTAGPFAALQPALLFSGTRTTLLTLVGQGAVTAVLLSEPGTPLHSWSILPASLPVPAQLSFFLFGFLVLATLVVSWLRSQMQSWQWERVQVMEDAPATLSAGAMTVFLVGMIGLLVALLLPQAQALEQHDPLAGHLAFNSTSNTGGTPALLPGASVPLGVPDITSNAIVLTWRLQALTTSGQDLAAAAPPLVLATYDVLTGAGAWSQSPTTAGAVGATLTSAPDATTLVAAITPRQALSATALPAFDASVHIAGAEPRLLAPGSRASTLQLASWQSITTVASGSTYMDTAAVPSTSDLQAASATTASLSASEMSRLLAVPSSLKPALAPLVAQWTTPGMTPLEEAQALAKGMRGRYTLVAQRQGSRVDGLTLLSAMLSGHKGNALTWATLHVLLCRMAGIPTRLASGYTPGTSNVRTGVSTVRADDATWLTQLATTAGWLDIGSLDQVETEQVPQAHSGINGSSAPPPPAVPTPPTVGRKVPAPRSHPTSPLTNRWTPELVVVLLLGLLLLVVVIFLVRRWYARYRRERGPLERELRWLLLSLLYSLPGVRAATKTTATTRSVTPRQAGELLASRLPAPLSDFVLALTDRYCRLVYAPSEPLSGREPRQQYRQVARQARTALKRTSRPTTTGEMQP